MKQKMTLEQKKEKRNSILITAAVILVAVCIIGLIVYNNVVDSGYFLRNSVAAQSENFTITGSMMTYYFWTNYDQYADTLASYMGLNTSQSLKSQVMDSTTSATWFDYFASMTANYAGEMLALCECAKAEGMELTEEDLAYIDENIASLKSVASTYGYTIDSYLQAAFGAGIREEDVRECMKISVLSSNYYNKYMDSLEYTDEDYDKYYEENKATLQTVDYISVSLKQSDFVEKDADGNPVGDVAEAAEAVKAYADTVAAAASEEAFLDAIRAYYKDVVGLNDEETQAKLDASTTVGMTASAGVEASDWAFAASVGDTKVVAGTSNTSYDVYYLTKEAYRNETPTRNVRHILLSTDTYGEEAQAKAEELYAQWEESGFDMTLFETLVTDYTDDTGSLQTGGLYENVAKGEMVAEFDAWLFDGTRNVGDTGLVSTDYGWHIMYYGGEGMPGWKVAAKSALTSADYEALVSKYSTSITFDQEVIYSINA